MAEILAAAIAAAGSVISAYFAARNHGAIKKLDCTSTRAGLVARRLELTGHQTPKVPPEAPQ